jgi:hypothetical protein
MLVLQGIWMSVAAISAAAMDRFNFSANERDHRLRILHAASAACSNSRNSTRECQEQIVNI